MDRILRSPIFYFLVGKEATKMSIHTSLVAAQSPALKALVSGQMEEANSGTAVWESLEPDIFALFAQFVYTGDYSPYSYKSDKKRKRLWAFGDDKWDLQKKHIPDIHNAEIDDDLMQCLAHAQLYVLADKYDITQLKTLSLHKLYVELDENGLEESQYNAMVELIKYIYLTTGNISPPDPLRDMVNLYIATDGKDVVSSEAFRDLVHEHGILVTILSVYSRRRVVLRSGFLHADHVEGRDFLHADHVEGRNFLRHRNH
jgi:hypothetical protein